MLGALWLENGAVAFISNESGKILYTNNAEKLSHLHNKDVTVNFSAHCKVKNHFLEFYQAQ